MTDTASTAVLETLIDTVHDSIQGYSRAGEAASSVAIKSAFASQAQRRGATLDLLNQELVRRGGELTTRGTVAGSLHRMWLNVSELFVSGDKAAIDRVEEGEAYLAGKFETALESTELDPPARAVIQRGLTEIRQGERLSEQLARLGEATLSHN